MNAWLNSMVDERMKVFSLKQLRSNSKGRFLFKDYQDLCEQGGHPVPRGISLLGGKGKDVGPAQVLLMDLMTHCWRTWDQVHNWLTKLPNANEVGIPRERVHMSYRLDAGKRDPIYVLMVELHPDPAQKL